jgi:hypothetical protein
VRDIRRVCSVRLFRVLRRFFAISKPSERQYFGIDILARPEDGGEAKAVLEYGGGSGARLLAELFENLLVINAVCEFFLTYN